MLPLSVRIFVTNMSLSSLLLVIQRCSHDERQNSLQEPKKQPKCHFVCQNLLQGWATVSVASKYMERGITVMNGEFPCRSRRNSKDHSVCQNLLQRWATVFVASKYIERGIAVMNGEFPCRSRRNSKDVTLFVRIFVMDMPQFYCFWPHRAGRGHAGTQYFCVVAPTMGIYV